MIIIGGEENNLIRCHPFIPKEEDSYLSLSPNIWDIEHYSILLNPTPVDNKYDNLLALHNIILNGPEADWDAKDYVIACLWDGKFGGAVPTAQEITCNMIPLVELAPDIRDSGKCLFANKDADTDDGVVNAFVCGVVHFATGYDLATWGAAIFTAGATGVGGEVFDGGITILKVGLKNTLPNIVKTLGRKVVKDAVETIIAVPKLLKSVVELVAKSPAKLADMIEGSIQILKHGPEVAESAFNTVKSWSFDASKDALKGTGNIEGLRINKRYRIFDSNIYEGINPKKVYEYFGDDRVIQNIHIARKGFEEEFKGIRISIGELDESSGKIIHGIYDFNKQEIILNVKHIDEAGDRLKEFTIIHEHGHALVDGVIFEEKFLVRMDRLGITQPQRFTYLENFFEFDDNLRMYYNLKNSDEVAASAFKSNIGKHIYDANFNDEIEKAIAAGYARSDYIAKSLAETEKFGFDDKNKLILDLIDSKLPHLKSQILKVKEIMLKNSGFTDSKSYDDALLNVLDEVKKLKG